MPAETAACRRRVDAFWACATSRDELRETGWWLKPDAGSASHATRAGGGRFRADGESTDAVAFVGKTLSVS
jgi:hypothetical protein